MASKYRRAMSALVLAAVSVEETTEAAESTPRSISSAFVKERRELGRGERVLPGLWRLRLPLPWPGVPHGNAWAIASGSGIVLVDTGYYEPGSLAQLERAMDQVNLRLEHVRLLVCTHAHTDHWGQAAPICDAARCELWMHPNHEHATRGAEDPTAMLAQRLEIGRQSGVPQAALDRYAERFDPQASSGIARIIEPDRDLVDGVEVETDLGTWIAYETPGHAPSHVSLFQPERRLLISGDHVLGRISLYYDYGWTPDPVGEYLSSLALWTVWTRGSACPGTAARSSTFTATSTARVAWSSSGWTRSSQRWMPSPRPHSSWPRPCWASR
jgi:glyoxylase-like metal-dependent hydrolase (beta-lactamase superfamily II)